jgi:hypothetical protein
MSKCSVFRIHCDGRRSNKVSMTMTAAAIARVPSALILAPQKLIRSLSDMQGSPFEKWEPFGGISFAA